jgi:hypothetical protein
VTPASFNATAMSRLETEPYSMPLSPAVRMMTTEKF